MTRTNEPAGLFIRVSTGGQDERQQVPEIERHCEAHGYTIARRYELNDKSASKGEQQVKLDEMIDDFRNGTIKVLVCWRSNRLERRGPEALFRLKRQVKDAGGRIEVTTEPLFWTLDLSGEAVTAINAVMDSQFSAKLSEDVTKALRGIKASGHVYAGKAPWGYVVEGPKYEKYARPTDIARVVVPQIFARCIAGQSLRQIAAWLDSKHVSTRSGNAHWNEGSVRWIIRCSAYAGRWIGTDCEAVIEPSIYDRANFALRNHPKRGPAKNPPLLAKLRCARCGSPMYRLASGKKRKLYYRCFGSGPQRKGCGNMVPLPQTDVIVATRVFMTSAEPHQDRIWVKGSNWDEEISRTKQLMREAVDTENFAELEELQAKLADYRSRDSVPGHYDLIDTGVTVSDYFDSLSPEGKREYLKSRDIRVEKIANPELGASYGVRVVLDGIDHGVYPYPPNIDAAS